MASWETVIGLECHVELNTQTKMFCGCRNVFGADPNTHTCPICMGHPGSLPVPNAEAIRRIVKIGLALDSTIAPHSLFHRKNYFYPDMPKNYQISQYDLPICVGGHLDIDLADGSAKRIGITRVHMEEDTGKTTHGSESGRIHEAEYALIDYNRAGVPLVECVSEPDMRAPEEAAAYLRELRATAQVRHQRLSCRRWILALRARDLVAHTLERGNSLLGAQLGRRVRLRRGASLQKQKNADGRDRTTHGPPRESKGAKRPSASSRSQTMIPKRRRTLKDLPRCGQTAN